MQRTDDWLVGLLNDLKNSHVDEKTKIQAAKGLREFVEAQSREMSTENYKKWVLVLLRNHLWQLINSSVPSEKIGGLIAVDELIDITHDDATSIIASYYRIAFKTKEPQVMVWAAKTLGHLSRINSTITSECVEFDMERALEWMQGERQEAKRHAACLMLKELAVNAPTLFFGKVGRFTDHIWVALRDPKSAIRDCAAEALGACLKIVSEREPRLRVQWYQKIYDEGHIGLLRLNNTESIHASLSAFGELLVHSDDFLKEHYETISLTILKYRNDRLLKKLVIDLIPRIAQFDRQKFIAKYLETCMQFLLGILKKDGDRSSAFLSVGEIAVAVGDAILPFMEEIITAIKQTLGASKKSKSVLTHSRDEAIVCTTKLGRAVGKSIQKHIRELLNLLFAGGLTQTLTDSLADLVVTVPEQSQIIQERLLDLLSNTLDGKPFNHPGKSSKLAPRNRRGSGGALGPSMSFTGSPVIAAQDHATVALALRTLGSFRFGNLAGISMIEFIRECILSYLKDSHLLIRREAAVCCCKLLAASSDSISNGHCGIIVNEILEELLTVGVGDSDATIRNNVLRFLDVTFDRHLAQQTNLQILLVGVYDEIYEIRQIALAIVCRLAPLNPAYVTPALRTVLIHLLKTAEYSADNRATEESAKLLGYLIRDAPVLAQPYMEVLMQTLLPKLKEDLGVSSAALGSIGALAVVCGEEMRPHIDKLIPVIIDRVQDQSSPAKREVAIETLGQLVEHSGYVIEPFNQYPKLLDTLLSELTTERYDTIRHRVIKVLGILGAWDPYSYKLNRLALEGKHDEEESTGKTQKTDTAKDSTADVTNLAPSSEDYYPIITIHALMRILRDNTLSQFHALVVQALMLIVKSLGSKSVQFLPMIMPPFLQVMRTSDTEGRVMLFQQLGQLVSRVKQHAREFLPEIVQLIDENWIHLPIQPSIVSLIEALAIALADEFRPYMPPLLKKLEQVLLNDSDVNKRATSKVLHAFEVLRSGLEDYLSFIVPDVIRVAEFIDVPMAIRLQALQTLSKLCQNYSLVPYVSRILHPLGRMLDTPDNQLQQEIMKTLFNIASQMGRNYLYFSSVIQKEISKHQIAHTEYEALVSQLQDLEPDSEVPEIQLEESDEPLPQDFNNAKIDLYKLNEGQLSKSWDVSQRSTKEDWVDWLRQFSVALLRESPSPALRACISLANDYHPLVRELFNAAFVICWSELPPRSQDELAVSLETALSSPNIPPDVLQTLLGLAEFMEQDEKPLPISAKTLGDLAEKCNAYAKGLHYREMEFKASPTSAIESLISVNNQLGNEQAALGILSYAQKHFSVKLKESWYEKLNRWDKALEVYERRLVDDPMAMEPTLGKMRSLNALGRWEQLSQMSQHIWKNGSAQSKARAAPLAAAAAWTLQDWDLMETYISVMQNTVEGSFYRSILAIHDDNFKEAQSQISLGRRLIDTKFTSLVGESYNRAYKTLIRVQQLAELEEVIEYKQQPNRRQTIVSNWNARLRGAERSVDTWRNILIVRSLVLKPSDDTASWLKFSQLCLKSGRFGMALKTLQNLIPEPRLLDVRSQLPPAYPQVSFGFLKYLHATGDHVTSLAKLKSYLPLVSESDPSLVARMYHKLGKWQMEDAPIDETLLTSVINYFQIATRHDSNWYKAWHSWALANYEAVTYFDSVSNNNNSSLNSPNGLQSNKRVVGHILPALKGFFRSISLSPNDILQDTLRILTLWFKYGGMKEVEKALMEGFSVVNVDTWLQVIPQLIARLHSPIPAVRRLVEELLTTIGERHPQALVYPLQVASKAQSVGRNSPVLSIMAKISRHNANLVDMAQLVSSELIRVSILWHELWHTGLTEASRQYFDEHNVDAMMNTLRPLHEMLDRGAETSSEVSFQQTYERDLQQVREWVKRWERSRKSSDMNQVWDLYSRVFRGLEKQLGSLMQLLLQHVSPKLLSLKDLDLAVPGIYRAGEPIVKIKSINPTVNVISSKQRPRKLIINGSDGAEYMFLLKGHEDLRQDERVMQLFGLVNTLLASESATSKQHLNIQRYSIIPLSPNSGLIGWAPNCETLHTLIKEYRESKKILINIEHKLMMQMASDYDKLPLIKRLEIFEYALDNTTGQDMERILWLKSKNAEVWFDRRTNYTTSLAVMSMVGYILGLGDRHPSNLMLRHTGKILHIDFGDCFEIAMFREKYPEKIPFRLTRMLINAMEVSGIEGTYRLTCENVMKVLRDNKEGLMAVLEAFVHDPVINWRLLTQIDQNDDTSPSTVNTSEPSLPDLLNTRAVQVIARVQRKLTGKDFGDEVLGIPEQVQRLIDQATSHENLCSCWVGWCPFW